MIHVLVYTELGGLKRLAIVANDLAELADEHPDKIIFLQDKDLLFFHHSKI